MLLVSTQILHVYTDSAEPVLFLYPNSTSKPRCPEQQAPPFADPYRVSPAAQALNIYKQLLAEEDADPILYTYTAACQYYMGLYDDAEATAAEVCRPCTHLAVKLHAGFTYCPCISLCQSLCSILRALVGAFWQHGRLMV